MAKAGAIKEYKFGPKNNWRRSVWNDARNRCADLCKSLPTLYLPGRDDIDREVAISKGFPEHNLIAIDISASNVLAAKASGALAIQADVVQVLRSWPRNRPVAAVMLDFCHGLEDKVAFALMDVLQRAPFKVSAIMVNLMRGRDASSNNLRHLSHDTSKYLLARHPPRLGKDIADTSKNRAACFYATQAAFIVQKSAQYFGIESGDGEKWRRNYEAVTDIQSPAFYSYKSGNLVYDSVVFGNIGVMQWDGWQHVDVDSVLGCDAALARRVVATMAVRTRRLRC